MNRKIAGIVFTIGVVVAALADTASAQNLPGSAALDTSLRGAVERKDVPGVVALITDRERVLYQSAFGVADVATGRPLTIDALFRIASMTKPVTSLALMQLVEQGRLGLDDPAEKYLPELAGLQVLESFDAATGAYQLRPASRTATVKHFLTHTSGLAYTFTSAIWRDFKPRAGETYPFGGPLLFDPGERWHYSTSVEYRPWTAEYEVDYAPKSEQTGADMAKTLTFTGLKQRPQVRLNGRPVDVVAASSGASRSL